MNPVARENQIWQTDMRWPPVTRMGEAVMGKLKSDPFDSAIGDSIDFSLCVFQSVDGEANEIEEGVSEWQ